MIFMGDFFYNVNYVSKEVGEKLRCCCELKRIRTVCILCCSFFFVICCVFFYMNILPNKYIMRADVAFARENYSEAVLYYSKALAIRPGIETFYPKYGYSLEQEHVYSTAITVYEQYLNTHDGDTGIMLRLAWIYMYIDLKEEAAKLFKKIAEGTEYQEYSHLFA